MLYWCSLLQCYLLQLHLYMTLLYSYKLHYEPFNQIFWFSFEAYKLVKMSCDMVMWPCNMQIQVNFNIQQCFHQYNSQTFKYHFTLKCLCIADLQIISFLIFFSKKSKNIFKKGEQRIVLEKFFFKYFQKYCTIFMKNNNNVQNIEPLFCYTFSMYS